MNKNLFSSKRYFNFFMFWHFIFASFLICASFVFAPLEVNAQINQSKEITTSQVFGNYRVHFNVLNSKTIPADIAETYHLKRGDDIALLNVAVTKQLNKDVYTLGVAASLSGKATNLMQQSTSLNFTEIQEGNPQSPESATYYLASFRYLNEEDIHFDLKIIPKDDPDHPIELRFTRRLFTEH